MKICTLFTIYNGERQKKNNTNVFLFLFLFIYFLCVLYFSLIIVFVYLFTIPFAYINKLIKKNTFKMLFYGYLI